MGSGGQRCTEIAPPRATLLGDGCVWAECCVGGRHCFESGSRGFETWLYHSLAVTAFLSLSFPICKPSIQVSRRPGILVSIAGDEDIWEAEPEVCKQ